MIYKTTTLLLLLFSYHTPSTTAYDGYAETYSKQNQQRKMYKSSKKNTAMNTDYPTASLVSSMPTASPVATPSTFVNTTISPSEYEYDDDSDIPTASPVAVNTTISPSEFEYDDDSDIPTASPVTTTSPSEYEYDPDDDESSEDSNSSEDDDESDDYDSSEDDESSEDNNGSCSISCEPGETGLKPYDKCTKFYACVAGVVKGDPIPCAKGTLFDDKLKFCNWKKKVTCPCKRNDKPKDDCKPSCKPHENHLKAFNACSQYYSCSDGKLDGKIRTVPDDSLLFDESIQSFNRKEDVKCHVKACAPTMAPTMSPPERPCCPAGFTGLRPYDGCKKYFHCVNGLETGDVLDCPRNMLFDARAMSCMWKKKVECVEEDMCERRRLRG